MKPQIVDFTAATDKLKALEQDAGEKLEAAMVAARSPDMKSRWRRLDGWLISVGSELSGVLLIALALAILCAPVGAGLAAVWFAATWAAAASGSAFIGWSVAALIFVLLCRYVWGVKLQAAARRAAVALIAGK